MNDDCGDGSDEANCSEYAMYDFENGLCDWKNDPNVELAVIDFFYINILIWYLELDFVCFFSHSLLKCSKT